MGTGRSLLQMTFDRILPLVPAERIIVVTNAVYHSLVSQQLPELRPENILLEPARRNTAPCIAWAAHHVMAHDPDASMVVMPSDHLITRERVFLQALERGFEFVESRDALLTLGIKPSRPETGYGYIQVGDAVGHDFNKVKTFTEKPNLEFAQMFLKSGEFMWNSGVFLWTAANLLKAMREYCPDVALRFDAPEAFASPQTEAQFIERAFPACPSISIDYALMEKAPNVYVEQVDPGWSDLGTWSALHEHSPKNMHGNVTQGCAVMSYATVGSVFSVSRPEKIVVVDGLTDYVVADTDDVLLICPLSHEQQIKQYVNDVNQSLGDKYL